MDWMGAVVRFIVSALVLMLVGFLLPVFKALAFFHALFAAGVIAVLCWVVEILLGRNFPPAGGYWLSVSTSCPPPHCTLAPFAG